MKCACAILSSVASPVLLYLSTLSHKRLDFRKNIYIYFVNIKFVFRFSLQSLSETFVILRSNKRDMIKIYVGLHVKHP